MTAARTSRAATARATSTARATAPRGTQARSTTRAATPRTASARGRSGASARSTDSRAAGPRSSTSRTSTAARSTSTRSTSARSTGRTPAARPTTTRRSAPRPSNSSRAAARSLPQEPTGPLLRVLPRRSVSLRTTLAISTLLFFAVLSGAVTIQAYRIQAQHRVDVVQARLSEAEDVNRSLRAEVAIAESPDRIMAEALAMGMVEPGPVLPLVSATPTTAPDPATEAPAPTDGAVPPVTDEGTPAR